MYSIEIKAAQARLAGLNCDPAVKQAQEAYLEYALMMNSDDCSWEDYEITRAAVCRLIMTVDSLFQEQIKDYKENYHRYWHGINKPYHLALCETYECYKVKPIVKALYDSLEALAGTSAGYRHYDKVDSLPGVDTGMPIPAPVLLASRPANNYALQDHYEEYQEVNSRLRSDDIAYATEIQTQIMNHYMPSPYWLHRIVGVSEELEVEGIYHDMGTLSFSSSLSYCLSFNKNTYSKAILVMAPGAQAANMNYSSPVITNESEWCIAPGSVMRIVKALEPVSHDGQEIPVYQVEVVGYNLKNRKHKCFPMYKHNLKTEALKMSSSDMEAK